MGKNELKTNAENIYLYHNKRLFHILANTLRSVCTCTLPEICRPLRHKNNTLQKISYYIFKSYCIMMIKCDRA